MDNITIVSIESVGTQVLMAVGAERVQMTPEEAEDILLTMQRCIEEAREAQKPLPPSRVH